MVLRSLCWFLYQSTWGIWVQSPYPSPFPLYTGPQGAQITGGSYNYRRHSADVMDDGYDTHGSRAPGRSRPLSQQLRCVYRRCLLRRALPPELLGLSACCAAEAEFWVLEPGVHNIPASARPRGFRACLRDPRPRPSVPRIHIQPSRPTFHRRNGPILFPTPAPG